MRSIEPVSLPDVQPAEMVGTLPQFRFVDPATLLVDDDYQRSLTTKSLALVERIVSQWSFRAFKPPVVVEVDGSLHVIDGQHTAIAAATHPGIVGIPVMVVEAENAESRADAFVRHNRDRIAVSASDIHFAMVAAKDDDALTLEQVCGRAGVKVLRYPPSHGRYKVGDTHAISTISTLISRRYALGARRVLEVLVRSNRAPVAAPEIRAVEHLLFASEYAGEISEDDIVSILIGEFDVGLKAKRFAAEHRLSYWRALASTIWMQRKRRRG